MTFKLTIACKMVRLREQLGELSIDDVTGESGTGDFISSSLFVSCKPNICLVL